MNPLVSVIVPAYNSANTVTACLKSIKAQTYKPIEVIVVDRGSRDGTSEIAKKFARHVLKAGPERAAQFNLGAKKAHGKYLYRVDSDFIVDPTVIAESVDICEEKGLDGVAVHNTSAPGLGFWAEVRRLERDTYIDDTLIVAVRFFSKKSWEAVGGMDESLYGPEDYDFHNRFVAAGFKWGRIKAIERHLGEPKTLSEIFKKHFWYGKQMLFYFQKHPSISLLQFNPIRRSYFRHYRTLFKHPILVLGLLVMTITKFFSGGLGLFIAWLTHYKPERIR